MDIRRTDSGRGVRVRPVRTLSRRDTAREAALNPRIFIDRFESTPFADPAKRRAYPMGPEVFTQDHKDLVARLRAEGARLSEDLAESRRTVATLKHSEGNMWQETVVVRAESRRLKAHVGTLEESLREANSLLEDLDATYKLAQNKRMSRVFSMALPERRESMSVEPMELEDDTVPQIAAALASIPMTRT